MNDPIAFNRLVEHVRELGEPLRYSGGAYRTRGRCHDGDNPGTVAISRGREGAVIFCHKCGGGEQYLESIGWTTKDLFDAPLPTEGRERRADEWIPCGRHGHRKLAEYLYRDEVAELVHGVTRCDHKCFAQWRPDVTAKSGRRWSLNGQDGNRLVRLVPYRLPELLAAVAAEDVVWLTEGEKDAHALVERGIPASCNAGGAGKWTAEHARHLHGADVRIVADRDEKGREHALAVVETLRGVARSVDVVQARHGKDAHDHFAGGGTIGDFITVWEPVPFPADMAGVGQ